MNEKDMVITGGASGLGRHILQEALENGDTVVTAVRSPEKLTELMGAYPDRLFAKKLDLTDRMALSSIVSEILAHHQIDIVVNNAGQGLIGATEEMTDKEVDDQITLLLLAPMKITRSFITHFRERGRGHFIQISSVGGQVAYPVSSSYHAAKFGLEGFSEAVNQELAEFGVYFTIVEPGSTRTNFGSNLRYTEPLCAYTDGAVGKMRAWIEKADETVFSGNPQKIAREIFKITRATIPPLRLALGTDAYDQIHAVLLDRLSKLEAQKQVALSVAYEDAVST